jgi:CMP-2-keto-3-deoxyoctulosonic acid synthetase
VCPIISSQASEADVSSKVGINKCGVILPAEHMSSRRMSKVLAQVWGLPVEQVVGKGGNWKRHQHNMVETQ